MSTNLKNELNAYAQVELDAKVASASPHRLITMLFDGAIAAITKAKFHINKSDMSVSDVASKGTAISRAIAIVEDGLKASLNLDVGGELAANLYNLYEYLAYRLVQANLNNDVQALDEVSLRLTELREAWNSIDIKSTSVTDERVMNRSGTITYGRV